MSIALALMAMLLGPGLCVPAGAPSFSGGSDEAIAVLAAPGLSATAYLAVPTVWYATNVTLNVTGLAAADNASAHPKNVTVSLNNTVIWEFNGTGIGPLGRQDELSTGAKEARFTFGAGFGWRETCVTLPKNAVVESARLDVWGAPPAGAELLNFSGRGTEDQFGLSLSGAGDVNGDGFDDVLVGACDLDQWNDNPGYAEIFFGGPDMDDVPDLALESDEPTTFAHDVSGAGDVNGDGYDDVVVGDSYSSSYTAGAAYVYFGGPDMDATPDVVMSGSWSWDQFGYKVSGAGDVNGDGYDDVLVGEPYNHSSAEGAGRAHIFLGGPNMDGTPDVTFIGEPDEYALFGGRLSGAGDVDRDGYDDVVISALQYDNHTGRTYIFLGGPVMDNVSDLVITGYAELVLCGAAVSGAGDVDRDGYDDVLVTDRGYPKNNLPGHAYVYLGGEKMDSLPDVVFTSEVGDDIGWSASGAGDFDGDGFDDVMFSGSDNNVWVMTGGPAMDGVPDIEYNATYSWFGCDVSCAGDVDRDGYDELIVGARWDGARVGRAYLYAYYNRSLGGILGPGLRIGDSSVWSMGGVLNGTVTTGDLAGALNGYLASAAATRTDAFGNSFVDIPLNVSARSRGHITLSALNISYRYEAAVPDFAKLLNNYTFNHQKDKDAAGNINVPLGVRSASAGRVRLSGLAVRRDSPPVLARKIGSAELDEDSWNYTLVDLHEFFQDAEDRDPALTFSVASSTNSSIVRLWITGNRYLSADASTGSANDDWSGTVEAAVACSDRWGQSTVSDLFTVLVRNVNDPPVITSEPAQAAEPGVPYFYNVTVRDVDGDVLAYRLDNAPPGMTIDPARGIVEWLPHSSGAYEVRLTVDDGNASAGQSFSVRVPNRPPAITSSPPSEAVTGTPYVYNVTAEDPNLDTLCFTLSNGPEDFRIDPDTGIVNWTPAAAGIVDITIAVSDGKERAFQDVTVTVAQGNRAPEFTSVPATVATVDVPYSYSALAKDPDGNPLAYSMESGPPGMTADSSKGRLNLAWTPAAPGDCSVALTASDGCGGEARQEFFIRVSAATRPQVVVVAPSAGKTLKGTVAFTGSVAKGTREVTLVQVRVDGGQWKDAAGTYGWTFGMNTRALKDGRHLLEFRAFDGKEYSDILKMDFKVDNAAPAKGFIPATDGLSLGLLFAILMATASLARMGRREGREARK